MVGFGFALWEFIERYTWRLNIPLVLFLLKSELGVGRVRGKERGRTVFSVSCAAFCWETHGCVAVEQSDVCVQK